MQSTTSSPSVSLFPFLTVLLATMGILVVMLVLAVKAASLQNSDLEAQRREETAGRMVDLQDEIDLHSIRRDAYLAARPELLSQIEDARMARANLQSAMEELDRQAALIAQQLQALNNQPSSTTGDSVDIAAVRDTLLAEIDACQTRLNAAREQRGDQPAKLYSIVPTSQKNGVARQPIYIECRAEGLMVQPYGISLATYEMPLPGLPGNPLDAALTTIREYLRRYGSQGDASRPYPLLVVRPDGASTYGMARRALTSWADEFGYELIPAELNLDYGQADPQMSRAVQAAVDRAKHDQIVQARLLREAEKVQSAARDSTQIQLAQGLMADRVNGGFMRTHQPTSERRGGTTPHGGSAGEDSSEFASQANLRERSEENRRVASPQPSAQSGGASGQVTASNEAGESSMTSGAALESLAERRGANWALPGGGQGVAYCRPVRIEVTENQLIIDSGKLSTVDRQVIPIDAQLVTAIDPLVAGVNNLVRSWGPPPPDGHWRPELRLACAADGKPVAERLIALMRRSGFDLLELQP